MNRSASTRLIPVLVFCLVFWLPLTLSCISIEDDAATWREGGKGSQEDPDEAVPVEVVSLERGWIESVMRFSATLEAEKQVQVFAEATRRVEALWVEEGDLVEMDQLLCRLQDETQQSELDVARIQFDQTKREYERQEKLFEQDLISDQAFNQIRSDMEQAQVNLVEAKRALTFTEVRSPISGTLAERFVNLGDFVSMNQPLFHVVDMDSIVARIYVPESEINRLRLGQEVRLSAKALTGALHGEVTRIAPVVDPASGTVKVTVTIPDQPGLRPGMYVEVELIVAVHDDALLIPKRAVVYDSERRFVFRIDESGERVDRVEFAPLLESQEAVEPESGFEMDDRIVVAGQAGLKQGSRVTILGKVDAKSKGNSADKANVSEPSAAATDDAKTSEP